MTVLLTVLFLSKNSLHNQINHLEAGRGSGPGTIYKSVTFQKRPDFFFFYLKTLRLPCSSVCFSVPHSTQKSDSLRWDIAAIVREF